MADKETTDSNEKPDPKTETGRVALDLDRINLARKYRDRQLQDLGVERFVKEYGGVYDVMLGKIMAPPINDVFAYTQSLAALLNFKNPYIAVNAKKKGTVMGARLLEQAVNYDWRELKIKEETELELIDVPLAGHTWHKTGYIAKKNEEGQLTEERIYSERVSWRDVVFSIGARRVPKDCLFMAVRIIRPTRIVKQQYPGNGELKGGPHPSLIEKEIKTAEFKSDVDFSVIWEIYDIEKKEIRLVAEGYKKRYLEKPKKWPDWMEEAPLDMLWFNAIPDEPYPMPDIAPWEPQILEKIKLLGMALNHAKRWNRMLLVRQNALAPSEQDKLERGSDGSHIEVTASNDMSLDQVARPLSYAELPPDIYNLLNRMEQIQRQIHGLSANDQGAPEQTRSRTLGELEFIQQGSRSRTDKKRDRFENHLANIARKIIAIRKANFDLEQMVKITGELPEEVIKAFGDKYDPATKSVKFTKEDIQGEYDVEVKAGSTLPLDKMTRMQILGEILKQSVQLAALPVLPHFIQVLIEESLKDYDIQALRIAFEQQQKEAEQRAAQSAQTQNIEETKTMAEADKRRAQADQIRSETALTGAEALLNAHKEGVLPEAIELGRGMGQLPG